jgi:hypothetical protein
MFSIILAHIVVSILVALHLASYKVDVTPRTSYTTYNTVPSWVDDDIIIPHKTTCALEDAIIGAQDSRAMALNIISILSK